MTVVVLLGAPGAGKGTQAGILAERLAIPHVATGDLFRAAVRDGSPIGLEARRFMERGQLVPDDITIRMLLDRLARPDAEHGVILDGFPRNRAQADALDSALAERDGAVDRALSIEVPLGELVRRLSGRWVCQASGHVYNETTNPPQVSGRCDLDGSPLIQRADDQADTIRARLDLQLASLRDVIDFYADAGILRRVDGVRPISAVTDDLLRAIAGEAVAPGDEAADPGW
ncbi:MAG TPA: adenylate kinase [Candidatus Limnocylindrales bacterium]|jgi:adenylate kinase|nr:adenylate kinase [Candidatus Limnocylindrales bacterium]